MRSIVMSCLAAVGFLQFFQSDPSSGSLPVQNASISILSDSVDSSLYRCDDSYPATLEPIAQCSCSGNGSSCQCDERLASLEARVSNLEAIDPASFVKPNLDPANAAADAYHSPDIPIPVLTIPPKASEAPKSTLSEPFSIPVENKSSQCYRDASGNWHCPNSNSAMQYSPSQTIYTGGIMSRIGSRLRR